MLTEKEAFDAMREFLRAFWERGCSNPNSDLAELLSWIDSDVWADGGTNDPAQWHDWLQAVNSIKTPTALRRVGVLLSVQRALMGMVTPELRAVGVSWSEQSISARFFYDLTDLRTVEEIVSVAETSVLADNDPEIEVHFTAEPLPMPAVVDYRLADEWVYMRCEDPETYS